MQNVKITTIGPGLVSVYAQDVACRPRSVMPAAPTKPGSLTDFPGWVAGLSGCRVDPLTVTPGRMANTFRLLFCLLVLHAVAVLGLGCSVPVTTSPIGGSPALADTSSSSDTKTTQHYGSCFVLTEVDMFTDEESHILCCVDGTLTDKTMIMIRRRPKGFHVLLSKGVQVHMELSIPVAIRIDKGPIIERDALWNPEAAEFAVILDEQLARQLLHDLAHGQRVAIQVGDERGHIQLDGSQRAIADFRQRVGLPAQPTLTIPPTQP